MQLHLSYFAWVRDAMGCGDESVEVPDGMTSIAELVAWLASRDAAGARAFADPTGIRAAIDGAMVDVGASLSGAREVALFPPVTGG